MTDSSNRFAKNHPAETVGLAGAIALLLSRFLGVTDADTITAIAIVIASLPAGITWVTGLVVRHNVKNGNGKDIGK